MSKILLIVTNQVGQPQMLSLTLLVWWVGCFGFFENEVKNYLIVK